MTPEQIRALANTTAKECTQQEIPGCSSGTSAQLLLLGEIAAQLSEFNQQLNSLTMNGFFKVTRSL